MRKIFFCLLVFGCLFGRAQQPVDSCNFRISLMTCAPGEDLYSLFGHTAIRVQDPSRGMDVVYNYGTFDDSDPLFYVHFTRGIMNYSLSAEVFSNFMQEYEYEHRAVREQVLNLSCDQKIKLYEALRKNTLEENRYYQYRFHTDNCTTRAGWIIEANAGDSVTYANILPEKRPSFRDMIHEYLNRKNQYWSEFGIDMLLGVHLDKKPSNLEAIHFLPDYLKNGMDHAKAGNKPLVISENSVIDFPETTPPDTLLTPMFVFCGLLILSLVFFFLRTKPVFAKSLIIFDIVFLSVLGLIGLVMAFVWLGRIDNVCRDNINIGWALPTHIIAIFFYRKKSGWIKNYFLVTGMLALVLLIGFPFWPQRMNPAVIPILATIIFRSYFIYQNRKHAENNSVSGTTGRL